ncbi:MAG: DUF4384 domain-containing protein [Bacteroidaceae bacterium]|nr:DUF4384 domain-containing protein [Bacteroidaceae bacterium]
MSVFLLLFSVVAFAQREKKVRAEYTYHAPENVSLEEAKRIALERAKMQSIADEYGTVVSQNNTTLVCNRDGESSADFFSLAESEVKGEWIETIGQPEFIISYEQGMLVVRAIVTGRIREIKSAQIDLKAELLCNGTDLKFARTDFNNGDDLFLYFQSPVNGYLTVYLLDEVTQMVYCLLPYKSSSESIVLVKKDTPYVFFSAKHAGGNAQLVDEYTMTCTNSVERNTLYIIFSPNEFTKANSNDVNERLPQELPFGDFQKWLSKGRQRDKGMVYLTRVLTITKT